MLLWSLCSSSAELLKLDSRIFIIIIIIYLLRTQNTDTRNKVTCSRQDKAENSALTAAEENKEKYLLHVICKSIGAVICHYFIWSKTVTS